MSKDQKIRRMSDNELREFVLGVVDGRIFLSTYLSKHDFLHLIFLPIAFGAFENFSGDEMDNIGMIWEYYKEAGPRAINSNPSFLSMRIMHKDDWSRAFEVIKKEEKRRKSIEI